MSAMVSIDAIQDGVALLAPDMTILHTNAWVNEHFGVSDLIGKKCHEGFQGRHEVCDFCPFGYTFKTGVRGEGIVPFVMKNNEIGWLSVSITPQRDEHNKIVGYVEHLKDVTDQKIPGAGLHFQGKIQGLLLEITSESVKIGESQIDSFIEASLGKMCQTIRADRGFIFSFDYDRGIAKNTHEWCSPGIESHKLDLQNLPLNDIEPSLTYHQEGRPHFIPRVSDYEVSTLREILEAQGIQSLLVVPILDDGVCIGSVGFDFVLAEHPKADTEYFFLEFFATLVLNLNQRRNYEQSLRESEQRLKLLSDVTMEGIVIHTDGVPSLVNPALCRLFETREEEILGKPLDRFFPPEELRKVRQKMELEYATPYESQIAVPYGTLKDIEIEARNFEFYNKPYRVAAIRDIRERKAQQDRITNLLKEKEVLLREVHHRIKNNMASMMSLLSLQADLSDSSETALSLLDAQSRMQSMSVLYDKLYRGDSIESLSVNSYLSTLVEEVLGLYSRNDLQIIEEIEDRELPVEILSPLGIFTNEIITNSIKHGFESGQPGTIRLSLRFIDDLAIFEVGDDGRGMPMGSPGHQKRGFGETLIHALTEQLRGTLTRSGPPGTYYTLRFPLTDDINAPES